MKRLIPVAVASALVVVMVGSNADASHKPNHRPTTTTTTTTPPDPAPAPINGQGYELSFDDQFDSLDTLVWTKFPWVADTPDVTVTGGVMSLRAPSGSSAAVTTLGQYAPTFPHYPDAKRWAVDPAGTGGAYFETRMRFTNDPWTYVAFWLYGYGRANLYPDQDAWCPRMNTEWDIVEGNLEADQQVETVVHKNTNGYCGVPDQQILNHMPVTPTSGLSDWHVWSGWWLPGGLVVYLDGTPVAFFGHDNWLTEEMFLVFQTGASFGGPPPGNPPQPAEFVVDVDWVRVWQKP